MTYVCGDQELPQNQVAVPPLAASTCHILKWLVRLETTVVIVIVHSNPHICETTWMVARSKDFGFAPAHMNSATPECLLGDLSYNPQNSHVACKYLGTRSGFPVEVAGYTFVPGRHLDIVKTPA